ncbi:MAG: GAF domain-containing protein [Burkholderiales bacterium]|nr:GAF domain-containing protein [Burkholderiales bacterium]
MARRRATGRPGRGVVRRVWQSGAPVWFPDVTARADFRRGAAASGAGLHSAFGFPVLADGPPLGVMEFYGRAIEKPDEVLLRTVRAIGCQIGQFIQRRDAERALLESEEQFRQLANNIPQAF